MSEAICFQCKARFESPNPDALLGDSRCTACEEKAKKIAFKVDIEMAKRRLDPTPSRIRQLFSEEEILKGDIGGAVKRIGLADLGITPHG